LPDSTQQNLSKEDFILPEKSTATFPPESEQQPSPIPFVDIDTGR
jgi:hypothetical protein